ncbi:peptide MFS transporter [Flavobacterium orientale]|uniref:Transporter YclF n=1 Tax=Flavobacterium orientale TaxID=1756020 RepID=A0A916XXI8_9FLAO|nr:peptide MFS transporter [Flavobacterium orientale]GGD19991.1 putative transporter YclF [Flavobacterium orientale]
MTNDTSLDKKELFGHPIGLFILFLTEMWERFSFYGMKALLIYYLVKYHLFSDEAGNFIVGGYAAMVYALPVVGGYLADKYLGFRKAVIFGGVLLVLGHLGLAYEGHQAFLAENGEVVQDKFALQAFFFSLSLIILGVGFLKANISSIVGALYEKEDIRRDSGFTIFYMGINLGSFVATLLCGWLGENYGWGYGFGAAGIGMILGLITFIYGQKYLMGKAEPKNPEILKKKVFAGISVEWLIYILSIASLFIIAQMVQRHTVVDWMLRITGAIALLMIIFYSIKEEKIIRERLLALTVLIIFSVVFWALFEQAYTSMNLYADRVLDRDFFGWTIPGPWFLSLNALFIILFAPVVASLWVKLGKYNPNTPVKFAFAIILVGLGFGMLVIGANVTADGAKIAMIWLVLAYFLHTMGELCLSPVGLSSVTKLAPQKIVGFMMGVWFLATASSEFIAAVLANLAKIDTEGGQVTDVTLALTSYTDLFSKLFWVGLIFGGVLLVLSPLLKKLMHGIK